MVKCHYGSYVNWAAQLDRHRTASQSISMSVGKLWSPTGFVCQHTPLPIHLMATEPTVKSALLTEPLPYKWKLPSPAKVTNLDPNPDY